MSSILITTFGGTWAIIPELIGFINYPEIKIFQKNKTILSFRQSLESNGIRNVEKFWVICTNSQQTLSAIQQVDNWYSEYKNKYGSAGLPELYYISIKDFDDLTSELTCRQMTDLIFRTVLKAKEEVSQKNGKLLLSLAGGRKTMSSDMQRASELWGCDLLFHIADSNTTVRFNHSQELVDTLDAGKANAVFPVEIKSKAQQNAITFIPQKIKSEDYPVRLSRDNEVSTALYDEINQRWTQAESLHFNTYMQRRSRDPQNTFYALQQLHPSKLEQLLTTPPKEDWIKKLPKTDLHCHFGGILDAQGMIKVALSLRKEIEEGLNQNSDFKQWIENIKLAISHKNDDVLLDYIQNKTKLRDALNLPKPIAVAAFLSAFKDCPEYLDKLIFRNYLEDDNYKNIGIAQYEILGDLQGSTLLQSKKTIEAACDYLLNYCKEHNIIYLELRCSPCNYTRGGLTELQVVETMINKFSLQNFTDIRLIIIGSRHGDKSIFKRHVNLAMQLLQDEKYKDYMVGFDIAGNESVNSPGKLRSDLLPLLKECVRFTIHAGENQPVDNIWEAVYELNADRIGHGLTLTDNPQLLRRFKDKNIFIELCPSSNFQIGNYNKNNYPLRIYLNEGLKVTVNTDNPGISRTTITQEYLFASKIANLNRLEILQLLRNSFQGVFLPKDKKKKLLIRVEEEIFNLLSNE